MSLAIWRLHLKQLESLGLRRGMVAVIVVIASSEKRARELAANCMLGHHSEESPQEEYLKPDETRCVKLGTAELGSTEMVVAVDYDYDYEAVNYTWLKE